MKGKIKMENSGKKYQIDTEENKMFLNITILVTGVPTG